MRTQADTTGQERTLKIPRPAPQGVCEALENQGFRVNPMPPGDSPDGSGNAPATHSGRYVKGPELRLGQIAPFTGPEVGRKLEIADFDALERQNDEMRRTAHLADLALAAFAQDELQKMRVVASL